MSLLYTEYEIVQKHMYFSKKLYEINAFGKHLMEEIETRKSFRGPRGGCKLLHEPTHSIHDLMGNILKPRVLCNNIYSSLLYFLDELLFSQVQNINVFHIDDDVFPLSFIYFNQDEWIRNWSLQKFVIDDGYMLSEFDSLMLMMFMDHYEEFTIEMLHYLAHIESSCVDKRLRKKLVRLVTRLKQRVGTVMSKTLRIYYKEFEKKN